MHRLYLLQQSPWKSESPTSQMRKQVLSKLSNFSRLMRGGAGTLNPGQSHSMAQPPHYPVIPPPCAKWRPSVGIHFGIPPANGAGRQCVPELREPGWRACRRARAPPSRTHALASQSVWDLGSGASRNQERRPGYPTEERRVSRALCWRGIPIIHQILSQEIPPGWL